MQDNQEILSAIFLLINKKKITKAKLLMDGISQDEFVKNLYYENQPNNYTEEMHAFVMDFDKVSWSKYITNMPYSKIADFFEYAKKYNIDLFKINHDEKEKNYTLFDTLITNYVEGRGFSNEDEMSKMIKDVITPENRKLSVLFSSLLDAKTKENSLRKLIFHYSNNTYNYAEKYSKILSPEEINILYSTSMIKKLFSANLPNDDRVISLLTKHVEENKFKPQLNLLSGDWEEAIKHGNIRSMVGTAKYKALKLLLENKFFDLEVINNQPEKYFSVFERVIVNNLDNDDHFSQKTPTIKIAKEVIKELHDLEKLGIEPKINMRSKDYFEKLFEEVKSNILSPKSGSSRGDIDKEVFNLSMDLHLPPHVTQRLIDFMDRRYGLKKDILPEEQKQELEKISNDFQDLLNKIIFTPKSEEVAKNKMKP